MFRRRRSGGSLHIEEETDDTNPMEGMGNLADAMLVLAVGMMLALLTHWSVDISSTGAVEELKNSSTIKDEEIQEIESNDGLQEKGIVYQDPSTGKFYVKVDE